MELPLLPLFHAHPVLPPAFLFFFFFFFAILSTLMLTATDAEVPKAPKAPVYLSSQQSTELILLNKRGYVRNSSVRP